MAKRNKNFDQQFKQDAVEFYYSSGKTIAEAAKALNIGNSTSAKWITNAKNNDGEVEHRGSGNHSSDEAKEIARLKKELRDSKDALEILKKGYRHTERLTDTIFKVVKEESLERKISVNSVLKLLDVSSSGYYDWNNRKPSQQQIRKEKMKVDITEIYNESYQIYGAPKITEKLREKNHIVSERTVTNYMKELEIKAIWVKPYTVTTIDPDFDVKLKNILNRQFNPEYPNAAWVTDITYIHTLNGFAYLTSIMDLYSRKIVGWSLSDNLSTDSVILAIKQAKRSRKIDKPLIIHSDRGVQFVSKDYKKETPENIFTHSYSRKGTPWDNACIESFHSLIKREWLNRYVIKDQRHAHQLVFEYIETFYNTTRIHGSCKMMSPSNFEMLNIS